MNWAWQTCGSPEITSLAALMRPSHGLFVALWFKAQPRFLIRKCGLTPKILVDSAPLAGAYS